MFALPLFERVIFLLCVTASAAGFWFRFRRVALNIFSSKPDPDFSLASIGDRAAGFLRNVILQEKVIRERPLPGIAHALVFWGFCAFGLVTANHLASGIGLAFLSRQSGLGSFYYGMAAIFGVAVSVSITGLFIRRFLVRPPWLGKTVSVESGVISGLILVLMFTYLGSLTVAEATPAARAIWWAHTLALLVFLPLVPHTKHLHLILSPFTVFFARDGFSRIPPLVGDEDFGLDTGRDLTRVVALQAYSCVECGRCMEHCPAQSTNKILNPKEIALGLRGYLNEFGPKGVEPLLGIHLSQEAAFQCTTCGACEYQCPVGVQHLAVIVGLRRGAVNTGKWEDDYGTKLFLALERNGNALGFSTSERDKFIQKQQFPMFNGTQEYCLWLGCMGAYDPRGREIISAFARVMDYLGATYGVLKKEKCTGDPARRLGNDLVFQQLSEQNLETLAQYKVKKIVSICPHCVRTISNDWKEHGEPPSIEHHSEFMARFIDKLPKGTNDGGIVYHDPCYLGRYRNVYDEPRTVLTQIVGQVTDPPNARERSYCCGAGGGLAFLGEETGDRISHRRASELAGTGARVVAAACPFCNTMLQDALQTVSPAPPKLLDIAEITAGSLPERN